MILTRALAFIGGCVCFLASAAAVGIGEFQMTYGPVGKYTCEKTK